VRRICAHCKQEVTKIRAGDASYLARIGAKIEQTYHGTGCDHCRETGYSGRLGIYEILELDDDMRDTIMSSPSLMDMRRACARHGMRSLREDGLAKVAAGVTTVEEIAKATAAG